MWYLHDPRQHDHGALHHRPRGHVAEVGVQEVEVPGLQPARELLELPHDLDSLVNAAQGLGEVGHRHVHVLEKKVTCDSSLALTVRTSPRFVTLVLARV